MRVFVAGDLLRKAVEDVERPDVELVHAEDGGVAADDEGQVADAGDAVGHAHRKLAPEEIGVHLKFLSIKDCFFRYIVPNATLEILGHRKTCTVQVIVNFIRSNKSLKEKGW